jgi:hypothetical protein
MAVAHDASASAKGAVVSSLSVSLTIANNANRCLVAFASAADTGSIGAFTSVTWNGSQTMTQFFTQAPAVLRLSGYYLVNPAVTTANVTVNFGDTYNECFVSGSSFFGVDQADPIGTARSTVASSGNAGGIGVDDTQSGGVVVGAAAYDLGSSGAAAIADSGVVPFFVASGSLSVATSQTSRTPALPSGLLIGDLVIAHCASENNATHSCATAGWTKLGQTNAGASWTVSHWWALNNGSLSAPTITWSGSVDASARTHAFRDVNAVTPCAYLGGLYFGTSSTHASSGLPTTVDNVLMVYLDHANANTALATPAGWTEATDSGSATGPCRTTLGYMAAAFAGTGPEDIIVTGAAAAWVQCQLEIYPAANGAQVHLTEQENIGSFDAAAVAYEVADVFNTLWWTFSAGSKDWAAGAIALNPADEAQTVVPPSLSDGDSFFSPTIGARRFPGHLAAGGTAHQAFVRRATASGLFTNEGVLREAAVGRGLLAARLEGASTISVPAVDAGAGLAPALFVNQQVFGLAVVVGVVHPTEPTAFGAVFQPSVVDALGGTKGAPFVVSAGAIPGPSVQSPQVVEVTGTLQIVDWAPRAARRSRARWPNLPKVNAPPWRLIVVTPEIARERARALSAQRRLREKALRARKAKGASDLVREEIIDAAIVGTVVHLIGEDA